jgi:hypothetical protein
MDWLWHPAVHALVTTCILYVIVRRTWGLYTSIAECNERIRVSLNEFEPETDIQSHQSPTQPRFQSV